MATEQIKKKRKKSALEKLEPEHEHPPDHQHAVLSLNPVSKKQKRKGKEGRNTVVEFLHHGSLLVPTKPAPPGPLLTIVGTFLKSYDFHDTSRMYATELALRRELDAWKTEMRLKPPNGLPDLVTLYKGWYKGYQRKAKPDAKSFVKGQDRDIDALSSPKKKGEKDEQTTGRADETSGSRGSDSDSESSSDSSSVESGSEKKMKDATPVKPERKKISRLPSSSNSSLVSSDSDADDEKDALAAKISSKKKGGIETSLTSKQKSSPRRSSISDSLTRSNPSEKKPNKRIKSRATEAVGDNISKISEKKKAAKVIKSAPSSSSSSSSTSSSSESSSAEVAAPDPWAQSITKPIPPAESSTSPSSSGEEARPPSKASNSTPNPIKKNKNSELTLPTLKSSTDSSVTLGHSSPTKASVNAAVITPVPSAETAHSTLKRPFPTSPDDEAVINASKRVKKIRKTPFHRVPSDTEVDPKLASNAYRGHDYGDRAHEVLSVTRGKDFTKAKNKKKGHYRGGAIDISGGRAVKF